MALIDSLNHLQRNEALKADPLDHLVASVSCGIYQGAAVLDLDYDEDSNAETDMNFVMNDDGKFIEIQGTAETVAFSEEEMMAMTTLAKQGIADLIEKQKQILGL